MVLGVKLAGIGISEIEEEAGNDEGELQTKWNKPPSEDAGDKQRKSKERQKERIPKKGKRKGLGNSVIKITT